MYDNWYAVQVRSGREEEIVKSCEILIKKDILKDCFIPKCKKMKKFKGTWKNVEEVLFKGYVFMITDYIDDLYNELKKITDFTKVLGNDGQEIYPIRTDEAIFLTRFGGEKHVVDMSFGYIEGDIIRITNGPLMGQEGNLVKIDRHKRLAYVDISLFDRITTIQVGLEIISKT
jgi:transcriptional antiterminator NusG